MKNRESYIETFDLNIEVVRFMRFIAYHEPEMLRKMITKAVHRMPTPTNYLIDTEEGEELNVQKDISTFLSLMETFIHDALLEHQSKSHLRSQVVPAIARIDSETCDKMLVHNSVERATNQLRMKPSENPRDLLAQELLKRWQPHSHESVH